jgi:hypothetical protein
MKSLLSPALLLFAFLNASAQTPCADLTIVSVRYSAFSDTIILVEVTNQSNENFNYPGFVLIDANGDTLAHETVNFFGIGEQSVHHLSVRPGVAAPLDHFAGTLHLYTDFFNEHACAWPLDQSLCSTGSCAPLVVAFENWGGALVLGDFAWSLLNEAGGSVASGTFNMTNQQQYERHSLCVPPGAYTYTLEALGNPSGGGPTMLVYGGEWFNQASLMQSASWEGVNEMEVPFYLYCIEEEPNAMEEVAGSNTTAYVFYQGPQTIITQGSNINTLEIFSIDGRSMGRWSPNANIFIVPSEMASGMYVVRLHSDGGQRSLRVVVP